MLDDLQRRAAFPAWGSLERKTCFPFHFPMPAIRKKSLASVCCQEEAIKENLRVTHCKRLVTPDVMDSISKKPASMQGCYRVTAPDPNEYIFSNLVRGIYSKVFRGQFLYSCFD